MSKRHEREQEDDFSFFNIDPNNLDKEWIEQPGLFFTWASKLADARRDHEDAKSELDVVRAELSRDIREDPETYGITKLTEAVVALVIPEQQEYIDAAKALSKARHRQDIYQAAVNALDHRKRALENLVDLHGQNYFAKPKAATPEAEAHFEDKRKERIRRRSSRGDE